MLLIYTPRITNRFAYVMKHVFDEQFGVRHKLTDDKMDLNGNEASIAYAPENPGARLHFFANGLLDESDIRKIELHEAVLKDVPVLFSHHEKAALSFDVFAAIFYLLSRYEEYFNDAKAEYDNYDYKNSILYKLDIAYAPVVEKWLALLKEILKEHFPSLGFKEMRPRTALTFDIDVAYAYTNRSILRTAGGLIKNAITFQFKDIQNRLLTLFHFREDIFDSYDYIFSTIKDRTPVFFFNMGSFGRYDKNPSHRNKNFRKLIRRINESSIVGLHPSYASNSHEKLIAVEKTKLEQITGEQIKLSRQHYLKIKLPETCRHLEETGIEKDFTMGYYYNYGFRAGTCNTFLFFDLIKNESTNLRMYPFAFMEGTLNDVLKMDIEEAKHTVSALVEAVRKYNGIFIPLWHNSTLCDVGGWKGWKAVFEHMLDELEKNSFEDLFEMK